MKFVRQAAASSSQLVVKDAVYLHKSGGRSRRKTRKRFSEGVKQKEKGNGREEGANKEVGKRQSWRRSSGLKKSNGRSKRAIGHGCPGRHRQINPCAVAPLMGATDTGTTYEVHTCARWKCGRCWARCDGFEHEEEEKVERSSCLWAGSCGDVFLSPQPEAARCLARPAICVASRMSMCIDACRNCPSDESQRPLSLFAGLSVGPISSFALIGVPHVPHVPAIWRHLRLIQGFASLGGHECLASTYIFRFQTYYVVMLYYSGLSTMAGAFPATGLRLFQKCGPH